MMARYLMPMVVITVIAVCALVDALEPLRPPTATTMAVAAASLPPNTATVVLWPAAPTLPATSASDAALASTTEAIAARRPPSEPASAGLERSTAELVSVRLADPSDFVRQRRPYWCIGASLQMAESIITGKHDGSRRSQRRLWRAARARSPNSPYNGANPIGWTAMLNELGLGPYRLVSRPDFGDAVQTAARALAETGKPVGLVVWAGHHAWVMTGFDAIGDPRFGDAQVTGVRVMDPLYPHTSKWGRAPAPDQLIGLEALARQFVRRHRPDYDLGVPSGWLLILPEG